MLVVCMGKTFAGEKITVRVAGETDLEKWNAFVDSHEHGSFFHCFEFGKIIQKSYPNMEMRYIVAEQAGKIAGIMPCFMAKYLFFDLLMSMPLAYPKGMTGGPLSSGAEAEKKLLEKFAELSEGCAEATVTLGCGRAIPALERLGFTKRRAETLAVDVSEGFDAAFRGFQKKTRQKIRKAERDGIRIAEADAAEDIDVYYEMYLQTMGRVEGGTTLPKEFFGLFFSELREKGLARIFFTEHDGKKIGGAILAFRKPAKSAYYFLGVSDSSSIY
ncbi:MAG TPA: GNAT family N-acetyltransferase, partial [Candidatus Norongarragalinales archaeon]|nr:GNAT family N-acetyltransferase [Candidatus Norongarragalinales archaeon]